jgi:DNA polymerase III subunit delta
LATPPLVRFALAFFAAICHNDGLASKGTNGMAQRQSREPTGGTRLGDFLKTPVGEPKPVYVLRGTDPYLLDQARTRVRQLVLADADPGLALMEMGGAEAALADVLDGLRTPPFLAPRRLVLIRDAEAFLGQKGGGGGGGDDDADGGGESKADAKGGDPGRIRAALLKYLEAPSPTGTLCLQCATWNENTTISKKVVEIGALIYCEISDVTALPRWLQGEAKKRHGKSLTYGAAQMLVEYLGADFASLVSALDILALYCGANAGIDVGEVDALVTRGHHERVWDLCDAVAEHNVPRALELLDAFWTEGMVAPQIVGLLRPTFRQLVRVKALMRRLGLDGAMAKAAIPYGAKDRVRRAIKGMSSAHLADAYQALVSADLEAKSTPNDRLAMETLVHRLCHAEAARHAAAALAGSE